ncbi:hotdog fold thioesterase [Sorangium sp. So ce1078]|uniref:hotdog fold thioesterase n=1 Tax=Sorangium sp. So ce1078 TaxID=3133329 RepID=UPI003F5D7A49
MTENVSSQFKDGSYPADLGVKIETAGDAQSRLALPYEERNTMFGLVHGGAIASLVSISAHAVAREPSRAAAGSLRSVSMHVGYVRAARKAVTVETRAVRRVRELGFSETLITDEDGNAVAHASSTVSDAGPDSAPAGSPPLLDPPEGELAGVALSDDASGGVDGAIRAAMAASPFLSRRQLRLAGVRRGAVEMAMDAAAMNLDERGAMHEGAVLTLIDAAGATCPWTVVPPSPGASGATIALSAQILGPLPQSGLVARAVVRARDARICWTDVAVVDSASRRVRAFGTVVYRFSEKSGS